MKSDEVGTRAVLITGASTGIGAACAIDLARRGWHVFAGVRSTQDGEALESKAGKGIKPLLLDVTKPETIAAAAASIQETVGHEGLQGLVNNAGIVVAGPLEFIPPGEIERQFQVNVFGLISVTQAFLPMIRAGRGRIVLMSSTSGFWCEPFLGAYAATKHALEGIGDSLRVELHPWKIQVALVEPGLIRTPIWEKSRAATTQMLASLPPEASTLYAGPIVSVQATADKALRLAIGPEHVAKAVRHALESRRPKTRYPVGIDARLQSALIRIIPDRLRDRLMRWLMKI
ncbi:MAG: SDR family oxidoreductase [Candidatus Hydrogenedentes bacterium]|nr:SDR family oxidoreductase [Candidatus Hydrogenedentota bacterium]